MWVAVGQFSAFAIGIISPMILSRYFSKGDYGTYKQVMYVYNTLLLSLIHIYAAALKQVPSCEFFPMEAVKTNVIGTDKMCIRDRKNIKSAC